MVEEKIENQGRDENEEGEMEAKVYSLLKPCAILILGLEKRPQYFAAYALTLYCSNNG